ncbi:MAG: hypothetical protein KUG79_18855 [Pseudomonadales bacterium]|nr:hypothetical protein [Pseudomonadales bacterium]
MLISFFLHLRKHRIPVSVGELLDCLAMLNRRLVFADLEQFYFLGRMTLVKDEKYYDRYDIAFGSYFGTLDELTGVFLDEDINAILNEISILDLPEHLLRERQDLFAEYQQVVRQQNNLAEKSVTKLAPNDEQFNQDQADAESVKLKEKNSSANNQGSDQAEKQAAAEAEEKIDASESGDGGENGEQGEKGDSGEEGEEGQEGDGVNGEKGLGAGDEPGQGIRDDIDVESHRSAIKVWQARQFEDYDPDVELGTRNIKMALRRLRKFAHIGVDTELDLADTIRCTARNGGLLDIKEIQERRNNIKVLLFLDVGGSMDDHIALCGQLFSAAKSEFKFMAHYYFHNFIYESIWTSNQRRQDERINTFDLIRRFGSEYKVIFVGDANMGRHEIAERGGSVEHFNGEPGQIWLQRMQQHFKKIIWLNPVEKNKWRDSYTTEMIHRLLEEQMYHLSVEGISQAMKHLGR